MHCMQATWKDKTKVKFLRRLNDMHTVCTAVETGDNNQDMHTVLTKLGCARLWRCIPVQHTGIFLDSVKKSLKVILTKDIHAST